MKILKKMAAAAAVITFLMGLTVMAAAAKEPYDYTITLHAGNKGTVSGRDSILFTASYDNIISFDLGQVQVTDEKYYVKGIRLAGRDNNTVSATTFRVTGDADYVVAYGIKGNLVSYTVKYQDASGKQLAPDRVFYGNVGDKPIVAYQYVENYVPQALALTKTLSANAAENVFTFVYAPGDAGTITVRGDDTTNVVTVVVPGTTTVTGTTGGRQMTAGGNGTTAGEAAGTAENGAEAGADTAGTDGADNAGEPTQPDQLVDLDEEPVPAANLDLDGQGTKAFPLAAAAGIGIAALAALIVIIVWIRKKTHSAE